LYNTQSRLLLKTEIRQALLSQFSLPAELFIGKLVVKDYDNRGLELVNLDSDAPNQNTVTSITTRGFWVIGCLAIGPPIYLVY
jgi:hypothetical protein